MLKTQDIRTNCQDQIGKWSTSKMKTKFLKKPSLKWVWFIPHSFDNGISSTLPKCKGKRYVGKRPINEMKAVWKKKKNFLLRYTFSHVTS